MIKLAVVSTMGTCAARRRGRVLTALVLSLLKSAIAESLAPRTDISLTDATFFTFSGTTADSEETTGLLRRLVASTAEFHSTGSGRLSTAELSDVPPGSTERGDTSATHQNSFSTVMESWTSHSGPEVSTELLSPSTKLSTTTVTKWGGSSTVANITDAYLGSTMEQQPATEARTVRDLTVTELTDKDVTDKDVTEKDVTEKDVTEKDVTEKDVTEKDVTDKDVTEKDVTETDVTEKDVTEKDVTEKDVTEKDVTESISHTDSTYISTTISRAGERTLLSVTSNSTTPYTEESSFSEAAPLSNTSEMWRTGVTQGRDFPDAASSTEADRTRGTYENHHPANATQESVSEREVPNVFWGTQSQTGQPNVTGSGFEITSNSGHNSTLPVTVVNSESEVDTSADSSTSGTSYTDSSASAPSVTPFVSPEDSRTNMSHQDSETMTTEISTGSANTVVDKMPDGPQTHMDETTVLGLTTALPSPTAVDDSFSKFLSGQQPFSPQTHHLPETTEVLTTAADTVTERPQHSEEDTHVVSTIVSTVSSTVTSTVFTTMLASTSAGTSAQPTTVLPSTVAKTHTSYVAVSTMETTQVLTTSTTEQHSPTSRTSMPPQSSSSSHPEDISTDVSTLHLETSTATPGNTTARGGHTTASYSKSGPTRNTAIMTTGKHNDRSSTQMEATTMQIPVVSTTTPGHTCGPCANGGKCVQTLKNGYRCECLPSWTGATCTEDVNECVSSPCPQDSVCVNTRGSFNCECALGYDLEDGRSCTQAKTFLGMFSVNSSLHLRTADLHKFHKEILQLLNASLSILHGYRRSALSDAEGSNIPAVNMFSMSANVTSSDVHKRIQRFLIDCSKPHSHCTLKLLSSYHFTYHGGNLCWSQNNRCDNQSSVCSDTYGTPYCQCRDGYFKKNPEDTTCRDCGDGLMRVNGSCVKCAFGYGGFNCTNFYGLIAKVVSPAAGVLLLVVMIALICTCCRKDKNDINKIIFKSGDLQMSPYAEFPKNSRVSMEWGRETIEMQENGSTKNLLQMTDIYYSPALRNADLERNGLYPFSGLPGSRHSCIYPAQWNPSFISDDSRRRDYF